MTGVAGTGSIGHCDYSTCGGLVWRFLDLQAGAGLRTRGRAGTLLKSAQHLLAQPLQPGQIVIPDKGLNCLDPNLINETAQTLSLQLDPVCLRNGAANVASATRAVKLEPHSTLRIAAADRLARSFDFTGAYRFGPRAHHVALATLRDPASGAFRPEAFHLRERTALARHDLGLNDTPGMPGGWQW